MPTVKKIINAYAIIPDKAINIREIEQVLTSGVAILQYRRKNIASNIKEYEAKKILELTKKYNAIFIINDDIKLCQNINADGVHLGINDVHLTKARDILGVNKIIGISCYSDINLAKKAEAESADYVAFGSIFPSKTKPNAKRCPLSVITQAKEVLTIPIVAIGGINKHNKHLVQQAGCDAYAMSAGCFSF